MEKDKRKTFILGAIGAIALLTAIVGATYAYFVAVMGDGTSGNINAETGTTDSLMFDVGTGDNDNKINIYATTENFGQNMGSLSESTSAKVILKANNGTNYAKYNYYLYLDVSANGFVYTTEEKTAELILTITDKEGTPLTRVDGLDYVTVGAVSGFDITTAKGIIPILDNYEIETTSELTQEWNITITLVNLANNQKQNLNKNYIAEIKIQKEELKDEPMTAQEFISAKYSKQGDGGLYYHNREIISEDSTVLDAEDKSYRYSGKNPNNYVCFGSDASECPSDNLYRIIGLFNIASEGQPTEYQYKLIKNSSIGNNNWSGSVDNQSNAWANSTLNTETLNGTTEGSYLNDLGTTWSDLIATHTWQVGGLTHENGSAVPKTAYNYEVGANSANTTYEAKVGLMYISDYGFAATPENWGTQLSTFNNNATKNNNWLYLGENEWTISRHSTTTSNVFQVNPSGSADYSDVYNNSFAVRLSFYLESSVQILGGAGTSTNPYRIMVPDTTE